MPTHVAVKASAPGKRGLEKDSVILLEQLRTIDKRRLKDKICCLSKKKLGDVDYALQISVGLINIKGNK